ncbi:MAG: hypothetical protein WB441_13070, partial [Nocardioidaceae bacterium]
MTPEQEEHVMRALAAIADAPSVEQVPPDVAARLDRVLTELATGPTTGPTTGTDDRDELARRRRSRPPRLLVAAATVAVVAAGSGVVLTRGPGGSGGD